MKAAVIFTSNSRYGEYEKGDTGIVDGYCRGEDDIPCAVVILDKDKRFVLADTFAIKFMYWKKV